MAEEALAQARSLDAHFLKTGKIVGPLHGVPISVKEMVSFKDRITHTGFVAWIGNVSPVDAVMVKILRKAGALLFVRTNLPQTCMVRCSSDPTAVQNSMLLNGPIVQDPCACLIFTSPYWRTKHIVRRAQS